MPRRPKLSQKKDTTTTWRVLAIICGLCWAVVLAADIQEKWNADHNHQ